MVHKAPAENSPHFVGDWARALAGHPLLPLILCGANGQMVAAPHERLPENERLVAGDLEPSVVAIVRGLETKRLEALRLPINELLLSELLKEPAKFTRRRRSLLEVDEMDLDAPLFEEAFGFADVSVILDTENLNFHKGKYTSAYAATQLRQEV
jgi:hypothetical protein